MKKKIFSSIKEILNDAKKGKMFILVDDKDRENEGDLIIPGSKCNFKSINFMAKHGRGLICLALSKNQITRWITTKEYHSQNVQKIISEYFLTQRINESDESYIDKTTLLQKLLVISMKCKQTVDTKHIEEAIILIEKFSKLYFDKHELNHLMELSD